MFDSNSYCSCIGQSGGSIGRVTRNAPTGYRKAVPNTPSSAALSGPAIDRQRRLSAASGQPHSPSALVSSASATDLPSAREIAKTSSPVPASASGEAAAADSDHESVAASDSQSDRTSGAFLSSCLFIRSYTSIIIYANLLTRRSAYSYCK